MRRANPAAIDGAQGSFDVECSAVRPGAPPSGMWPRQTVAEALARLARWNSTVGTGP
jgi:hypothetical protein